MKPTYPALIRAAATSVLELRRKPTEAAAQALIGRLYVIAEGLERGDPAESIAGDPTKFITGDPAEFKVGDPGEFAHVLSPDVRKALAMGPDGPFTVEFELAARDTFAAHERDVFNPDVPDRSDTVDALHEAVYPDTGDRSRAAAYRALYWFWMDAPPPEPVDPDALPFRATFIGQAWVMDHAVEVDDARHTFYVSPAEVEECFDRENGVYDELTEAALAPAEVKGWDGPYDIRLEPRAFQITDDRPGAPVLYADDVAAVQDLLTRRLTDDRDGLDETLKTQIVDLADAVEDAQDGAVWVFEGRHSNLTVSLHTAAD